MLVDRFVLKHFGRLGKYGKLRVSASSTLEPLEAGLWKGQHYSAYHVCIFSVGQSRSLTYAFRSFVWQDLQPKETTRPISSTEFQVFDGHDGSAEVEACRACHVVGVDWAVASQHFQLFMFQCMVSEGVT